MTPIAMNKTISRNRRILIVDDNPAIHQDFRKIFGTNLEAESALSATEAALFGEPEVRPQAQVFEIDSAFQGQEALEMVHRARAEGRPYAMVFMDVRMPPGWDGVETTAKVFECDRELQVVICTEYSDHSWVEIQEKLGHTDRFVILKKPFDNVEVLQLAHALTEKWRLAREAAAHVDELENRVRERVAAHKKLEDELRQAQKLESVGRLAAGIAHEINTPVQFVSDSCHFLRDGVADLGKLVAKYEEIIRAQAAGQLGADAALAAASSAAAAADAAYLAAELPAAVDRSLEGLQRVASIVRAMKEFAHADNPELAAADLNRAIQSTLTIAQAECKHVATVKTDLAELPPVICHLGELNQAVLNIVVNAAHAIGDSVGGSGRKGLITVRTRAEGDHILIDIADDGPGIPESVRHKIFEPFFTTKAIGRGTGQGLALARSAVVSKHRGELTFDTREGHGTTFHIRLPVDPRRIPLAA